DGTQRNGRVPLDVQDGPLLGEGHTHLLELPPRHTQGVQLGTDQTDVTTGRGDGHREHTGVDAFGHDRVLDRGELLNTLDGDQTGAPTADRRTHAAKKVDD